MPTKKSIETYAKRKAKGLSHLGVELGDEQIEKIRRIARENYRSVAQQVRFWIDQILAKEE